MDTGGYGVGGFEIGRLYGCRPVDLFQVGKTGEERYLVIFKGTHMNNHFNGEPSKRPFH